MQGANSQMRREQGVTKKDLGSTKNYSGEPQENNSGSREKTVKFQREPEAWDPPLRGLIKVALNAGMNHLKRFPPLKSKMHMAS